MPEEFPKPAPAAPRRRPGRVHLVLFLATLFTVGHTGWFWETTPELNTLTDFLGSFLLFLRPAGLFSALPYTLCIFAILGAHEMGHYLACRYYRIPATLPFFIPGILPFGTFGAVIRIRGRIPHRKALFDIAAAGPIAGFAVALPILIMGFGSAKPLLPEEMGVGGLPLGDSFLIRWLGNAMTGGGGLHVGSTYFAAWFGLLVTSMNLFPVGQLDGGHVAYAISRRFHRTISRLTIVLLCLFVLYFGVTWLKPSVYTLWCLILLWMRDRHPPVVDETIPLGIGRRAVAFFLLILFCLTFIPVPFLI